MERDCLQHIDTDPVLGTLPGNGLSQTLLNLTPCAVHQPHIHPRASEIAFVYEGVVVLSVCAYSLGCVCMFCRIEIFVTVMLIPYHLM